MTVTVATLAHPPTPPQPGQTRPAFAAASYDFVDWWANTHAGELDNFVDNVNAAFVAIAASEAAAIAKAAEAAASATTAATKANEAAASALNVASAIGYGAYSRDQRWYYETNIGEHFDTLVSPYFMSVNINGANHSLDRTYFDLSATVTWDTVSPDYRVAANRAGKNFYIHAVLDDGVTLKVVFSANASGPTGYGYSRLIGGFHCLCVSVGTISGHPLSGFNAGDVIPASVWDLIHRPVSLQSGMVYAAGIGKWVDIYLASVSAGALASINGGTIADGTSATKFHWLKFSQWLGSIGKRLPTQHEFVALSLGANQGTNIAGSADPVTTGGHTDTAGRRMISNIGCEDTCGALWQMGMETVGYGAAAWVAAYDANDSGVLGSGYLMANRIMLGGSWSDSTVCGSRASASNTPVTLNASYAARGISDPLAVSL